jgi:hypothetical protein
MVGFICILCLFPFIPISFLFIPKVKRAAQTHLEVSRGLKLSCMLLTFISTILICSSVQGIFMVDDSYFPFCRDTADATDEIQCRQHRNRELWVTLEVTARLAIPYEISAPCYSSDEMVCSLADSVFGGYSERRQGAAQAQSFPFVSKVGFVFSIISGAITYILIRRKGNLAVEYMEKI